MLLLRLSLFLAIVFGIGAAVMGHLKVAPKVSELKTQNESLSGQLSTAQDTRRKAESNEKKALAENQTLKDELAQTQDALQGAVAREREQRLRADQLDQDLAQTRDARTRAEQALNRYQATGVSVDEILSMSRRLREILEERDVYLAENQVMARTVQQLEGELHHLVGDGRTSVPLPEGLKGKIIAVDDKWDFVVLDIGAEQGVLEHGRLLVNRGGTLIAQVEIKSVSENRSIADILPEWKSAEVLAGDEVIH